MGQNNNLVHLQNFHHIWPTPTLNHEVLRGIIRSFILILVLDDSDCELWFDYSFYECTMYTMISSNDDIVIIDIIDYVVIWLDVH